MVSRNLSRNRVSTVSVGSAAGIDGAPNRQSDPSIRTEMTLLFMERDGLIGFTTLEFSADINPEDILFQSRARDLIGTHPIEGKENIRLDG